MKPVPVPVKAPGPAPAGALVGDAPVIVGNGFRMLSGNELENPPLGDGLRGFTTVICNSPAVAISAELKSVSTHVEFTKVVDRLLPLTATADTDTKFEPITFSQTAAPPRRT